MATTVLKQFLISQLDELNSLKTQLCMSYTLLPASISRTPRKTSKATAATNKHHTSTVAEKLPELFGRDLETSIDLIIKEYTHDLDLALDRPLTASQEQQTMTRNVKSITMEDTFDIYDRSSTIYVDMRSEQEQMDAVMQQVDLVTGRGMDFPLFPFDNNDEHAFALPQPFADFFARSEERTTPSKRPHQDDELSVNEQARSQNPTGGDQFAEGGDRPVISGSDALDVSPRKRARTSIDAMDARVQEELHRQTTDDTNQLPRLFDESMHDLLAPVAQLPEQQGFLFL
jgi:hypothetical protein